MHIFPGSKSKQNRIDEFLYHVLFLQRSKAVSAPPEASQRILRRTDEGETHSLPDIEAVAGFDHFNKRVENPMEPTRVTHEPVIV